MANILGLSCYSHDSAACLVQNGIILAAGQEERFTRKKNSSAFPLHAINFCVQKSGITFDEIDLIVHFEKPYLKFSRLLIEHLNSFPLSLPSFLRSMPNWLDYKLTLPLTIESELSYKKEIIFLPHHLSHMASSYFTSNFENAALLSIDGVGEWASLALGEANESKIITLQEIHYPDSLGMLYTTITVYLGFKANQEEGTTMALAACGEPSYLPHFNKLLKLFPDGSFRMDQSYFHYRAGTKMWSKKFEKEFGPPRLPEEEITDRHRDIAASLQIAIENCLVGVSREAKRKSKSKNLCLSGGVALNCVANSKISEQSGFEHIFIQPGAGDAGGAIGAALYGSNAILGEPRKSYSHSYWGPEFKDYEIRRAILRSGWKLFETLKDEELVKKVASNIMQNKIIGWFQGAMEFGPRALGNRSIFGNPKNIAIRDIINSKIKRRENFQPFAPMVLAERASEFFDLQDESPFMLLAPRVWPQKLQEIPAVVHYDGTARVQTIGDQNPLLRKLLTEVDKQLGVPILLNTSLNRKGEPIVCKPEEAIDVFQKTDLDFLAIGTFLLRKD